MGLACSYLDLAVPLLAWGAPVERPWNTAILEPPSLMGNADWASMPH